MPKLTDLTKEMTTAPADDDLMHVVDISDTSESPAGSSYKIQTQYLFENLGFLPGRSAGQTFQHSTSTPSDFNLKTNTTLTADVDGIAGNISEVTGYASGMIAGNETKAYEAILTGSASDVDGYYIAFKASDFTTGGGSNGSYGLYVGQNYLFGAWLESGTIVISDDAHSHTINCIRTAVGDGTDFILNSAPGVSGGAPQNGGDFIISAGSENGGGTDGEIHFKIGSAIKGKFDSDGKFNLASGTGCNEIVTGITAANTDDQLATAKSIYDAILELSHTQYEYFTATAGQTSFTILGPTPLNAHAAQLVVQGIVYKYGADPASDFIISGNTITWYNNNYTLQLNDVVQLWYDGPGSEAREWTSYSGTLPVAGGTLVVTAAQLGLTDARQITDATLWGRGTDQNWYKAMNTWGGATHEFNFTIPTLADPNLGDLVIQVAGGASSVASQPFKISFEYTSTNFLT